MDRPLQVSFFLCNGRVASYHETELADHVVELAHLFPDYRPGGGGGSVLLDGYISVVLKGQELLGTDYWIEFVSSASMYGILCAGDSYARQTLNSNSGQNLTMTHADGNLRFEVVANGRTIHRRELPLRPFAQEWTLMRARIDRMRHAFGDLALGPAASNPFYGHCDRLLDMIDPDLAAYTAEAPLDELLRNPVPQLRGDEGGAAIL